MHERMQPSWRKRLPMVLVFGAPCFAAAMTVGIAAADLFLLPRITIGAGRGDEVVVGMNAVPAFLGAAAGGLSLPGRSSQRVLCAIAGGAFGVVLYAAILWMIVVLLR